MARLHPLNESIVVNGQGPWESIDRLGKSDVERSVLGEDRRSTIKPDARSGGLRVCEKQKPIRDKEGLPVRDLILKKSE